MPYSFPVVCALIVSAVAALSPPSLSAALQEQWQVEGRPTLEFGDDQGSEWGNVVGLAVLPSGAIVVSDSQRYQISIFDSTGRLAATAGRQGGGPGEFRILREPMLCSSDEVFFWDAGHERLSVFDTGGTLVRDFRTDRLGDPTEASAGPWHQARMVCNQDGVFARVSRSMKDFPTSDGPGPVEVLIELANEAGPLAHIQPFDGEEIYLLDGAVAPRPLGKWTVVALDSTQLAVGVTSEPWVSIYSLDGRLKNRIDLDLPRAPVTQSVIDDFVQTRPERHRATWARLEYPDSLPAYSNLLIDSEGLIWVQQYRVQPADPYAWRVYSSRGDHVASLQVEAGFRIQEVGPDYVVGVAEELLGTHVVRVYPLKRSN
jgi:hypothetical protein